MSTNRKLPELPSDLQHLELPSDLQELIFKTRNNIINKNRKSNYNAYTVQLYTLPDTKKAATIRAVNKNSRSITINTLRRNGFSFAQMEKEMAFFFPPEKLPAWVSQNGYVLAPFPTYNNAIKNIHSTFPEGSKRVQHSNTLFTVYIPKPKK
jgi:hypothetical protein